MEHILIVFGTRPEWIKILPVIREFTLRGLREKLFIVNTHQHEELLNEEVIQSGIQINHHFSGRRDSVSLNQLTGLLMSEFHHLKRKLDELGIKTNLVLAQGDTATTFCSALFAFHEQLPFYHIEAGLRTYDFSQPFPEEFYRKTITSMAAFHFAPTDEAIQNLIQEDVDPTKILLTGNTVIDNLIFYQQKHNLIRETTPVPRVLITVHRRENQNGKFDHIFSHIDRLCRNNPDHSFTWISHPGLSLEDRRPFLPGNLDVSKPLSYLEMISLYHVTSLIITDSGGIQEEAAFLGIPLIILRSKTERKEGINEGISVYFDDTDTDLPALMHQMNAVKKPGTSFMYGKGQASAIIVDTLLKKIIPL
jgi:UDP-N-acetylglucosamine 2-epimerase (non-hydrolysing)